MLIRGPIVNQQWLTGKTPHLPRRWRPVQNKRPGIDTRPFIFLIK
jgi:hypothetical protein